MTPRPGKIAEIIDIDLPRPRDLSVINTELFGQYAVGYASPSSSGDLVSMTSPEAQKPDEDDCCRGV
jgi:hypothetical protein